MGPEDKLEKRIQADLKRLIEGNHKDEKHHARQRERFASLWSLLERFAESIAGDHVRVDRISADCACLRVGRRKAPEGQFEKDIDWIIQPNAAGHGPTEPGEGPSSGVTWFLVKESRTYRYPHIHVIGRSCVFDTETEVLEYLAREIAEKITHYRHVGGRSDDN